MRTLSKVMVFVAVSLDVTSAAAADSQVRAFKMGGKLVAADPVPEAPLQPAAAVPQLELKSKESAIVPDMQKSQAKDSLPVISEIKRREPVQIGLEIEGDAQDDSVERALREALDEVKRHQIRIETKLDELTSGLKADGRPVPRLEISFGNSGEGTGELGLVSLEASLNEIPLVAMRQPMFVGRDNWSLPLFDGPAGPGTYKLRMRVTLGRPTGRDGRVGLGQVSITKEFPVEMLEADRKIGIRIANVKSASTPGQNLALEVHEQ